VPYFDETVGQFMDELMGHPFDLVLGRRTYDIFAGFWPTASEEEGAKPLNEAVKHVASRGRPELTWERSQLIEGDVVAGVRALKQQDGPELQVHGSGDLLQTLWAAGLVDEIRLLVFPAVQGRGRGLVAEGTSFPHLELLESQTFRSGVVLLRYAEQAPQPRGRDAAG
jgi:dihydrofolate reductase